MQTEISVEEANIAEVAKTFEEQGYRCIPWFARDDKGTIVGMKVIMYKGKYEFGDMPLERAS